MSTENETMVWDPLLRLFHWLLVCCVALLFMLEEHFMALHVVIGFTVLGLLLFRTVWGFIGPPYARFSQFVRPIAHTWHYLKGLPSGQSPHTLGHNPAGGMMVILLMGTLLLTALTGIMAHGAENRDGPLAGLAFLQGPLGTHWFGEVHELLAGLLSLLVTLHLGGVLVSSLWYRENLVKSMITGRKRHRGPGPHNGPTKRT
ncbi:MAG: cytochrome b/b6 domain-containing protein [Magnetococcus sp. MYC-9]